MSAAELRQAAETLRYRAGQVTRHAGGDPLWFDGDVDLRNAIAGTFKGNVDSAWDDARWIAIWGPSVGVAIADWLDATAQRVEDGKPRRHGGRNNHSWRGSREALAVARLINGGVA